MGNTRATNYIANLLRYPQNTQYYYYQQTSIRFFGSIPRLLFNEELFSDLESFTIMDFDLGVSEKLLSCEVEKRLWFKFIRGQGLKEGI